MNRQVSDLFNRIRVKRRISGIMAAVLIITGVSTVTYFNSREVHAKDTLESISQVIRTIKADGKTYTILEIVPDTVSFNRELLNCRGEKVTISGNQSMGFMGYYVAGSEPVVNDYNSLLNDIAATDKYVYSSLSDSNLRYGMFDELVQPLLSGNDCIATARSNNNIDFKPLYIAKTDGYHEIREGEYIDGMTLTEAGYRLYAERNGYKLLDRDYTGKYGEKYVDIANGNMISRTIGEGDYVRTLKENEPAFRFIQGYLSDNLISDEENIDADDRAVYPAFMETENEEGQKISIFTGAYDDNFCYVSYNEAYENRDERIDVKKGEERTNGFFDPNVIYISTYVSENNTDPNISADVEEELEPNVYAEFRYDADLTKGYLPADREQIIELTDPNIETLMKYSQGTPLYTKNAETERYEFAGLLGDIYKDRLTKTSDAPENDNQDTGNENSENIQPDTLPGDDLTGRVVTEKKLNSIALAAPAKDPDKIIEKISDDEISDDDDENVLLDRKSINGRDYYDEGLADTLEEEVKQESGSEDELEEDDESGSITNNGRMQIMEENDGAQDDPAVGSEQVTYYIVPFYYTDKYTDKDFYSISCIRAESYENGAQYVVDTQTAFVQNLTGRGTIIVRDECPDDYFLYDYVPGLGSYSFMGAGASVEAGNDYRTYNIRGSRIYYRIRITNNEWFKRHILDREEGEQCRELPIRVVTKTVSELTPPDVAGADLISLMSGNARYCIGDKYTDYLSGNNDISFDSLRNLMVKSLQINNVPVIADYKIVNDYTVSAAIVPELKEPLMSVLIKALELPQTSLESYYATLASMGEEAFLNLGLPAEYSGLRCRDNNDHYVKGNIYIYNRMRQSSALSENICFLNDSITQQFTPDEKKNGFSEVTIDIETENYFRKAEKLRPLDVVISQATAVRYIIGYDQKRKKLENKGTMRILEIEPCCSFELTTDANRTDDNGNLVGTKLYVNNNTLIDQEGTSIIVTRMTTAEFIGRIEDINVDYDMIYIGMNTGQMNTRKPIKDDKNSANDDVKAGRALNYTDSIPDYNDNNMDGLVYCNVGDTRDAHINMKGMFPGEYKNGVKRAGEISPGTFVSRYSGNDITQEKRDAVRDFVAAGYPVVLADNFLVLNYQDNTYSVNRCAIDSASYMFSLIDSIKNEDNVFRLSNLSPELFNFYINLSKPELTMYGDAKESMSQTMNLKRDSETGFYYVPINFRISNRGAVSASDKYEVNLLVDVNADGKYSPTQEVVDFTSIVNADTGEKISKTDNTYILDKDVTYYADYRLSGKHSGVIPWRLVVKQTGNVYRRANATGYFQAADRKPEIRVLQINTSSNNYGSTWNMQNEYAAGPGNKFYDYVTGTGQAAAEGANIPYDVKIKTITANEFSAQSALFKNFVRNDCGITKDVKNLNAQERLNVNNRIESALQPEKEDKESRYSKIKEEYLKYISDEKFDMIIMGFGDCYVSPNIIAVDAIKDFINSGKSILLTHDCTSYVNAQTDLNGYSGDVKVIDVGRNNVWGYEYNVLLRNLIGMDRYNVLGEADTSSDNKFEKDGVYKPRTSRDSSNKVTDREAHGFSYGNLTRYSNGTFSSLKGNNYGGGHNGQYNNLTVSKVNDGQITKYPYQLPRSFPVAKTHAQYYQLDFATDDDYDGESDIVVWYCIEGTGGDDIYKRSPNDVRNNYYIYNKGNITYSGVGHESVMSKGSVAEIKLFVNTMIAAYRAGLQNPEVTFRESTGRRDTDNIYITYDEQLDRMNRTDYSDDADETGLIGNTKEICFVPKQVSLVQNTDIIEHVMSAQLYYEVPAGSAKDKDITYNTSTYPVKNLRSEILELWYMNEDGEWVACEDIDAELANLKSETVYKVKFSIDNMAHIFESANTSRLFVEASDYLKNNKTGYESRMTDAAMAKFVKTEIFDLD